jgi:hypothetical protein
LFPEFPVFEDHFGAKGIWCVSGAVILLSHPTKENSEVLRYIHASFAIRII